MQFFEAGPTVPPAANRKSSNTFVRPVRYISNDVEISLEARQEAVQFPYRCHYFATTGKLLGVTRSLQGVPEGWTSATLTTGWGNSSGTFWKPGRVLRRVRPG